MAKQRAQKKSPKMANRLDTIERLLRSGFRRADQWFDRIDRRFEVIDRRIERIDTRFDWIEQRLEDLALAQREFMSEFDRKFTSLIERIDLLIDRVDGFMKKYDTRREA
jgi:hypothetical protein